MNQNIVLNTENLPGHAQRKSEIFSNRNIVIKHEENTAGRDIFRPGCVLPALIVDHHRKSQRKTNGTTDLPALGAGKDRRGKRRKDLDILRGARHLIHEITLMDQTHARQSTKVCERVTRPKTKRARKTYIEATKSGI